MLSRTPGALALSALFAGLVQSPSVHAEDDPRATPPAQPLPADDDEPAPALVPYHSDAVGGHFHLGLSGETQFPFGSVSEGVPVRERSGWGGGGTLDMTYGLDRFVALGVYGGLSWLGASSRCEECSARTLSAGGLVRYHISQGLKLDPWVSYGFGLLVYGAEVDDEKLDYAGLDLMRLQVGANWYATRHVLLGPVVGLTISHLLDRPSEEVSGGPLVRGTFGLRLAFDVPGRP